MQNVIDPTQYWNTDRAVRLDASRDDVGKLMRTHSGAAAGAGSDAPSSEKERAGSSAEQLLMCKYTSSEEARPNASPGDAFVNPVDVLLEAMRFRIEALYDPQPPASEFMTACPELRRVDATLACTLWSTGRVVRYRSASGSLSAPFLVCVRKNAP